MTPWQKVNKNNLEQLRLHYLRYDPYCHLNIIDLWSYRGGVNHWFQVGDTMVYRLNNYMDNSLYLTVLGNKSAKHAIKELSSKNKKLSQITLKCVPESTLNALGSWDAVVNSVEDPDNHDYIFDVESLVNLSSPSLKSKQKLYNKLVSRHPKLKTKVLNNSSSTDRRLLYRLFKRWVLQTDPEDWQKEFLALKRALKMDDTKLVCLGFFDGEKIVGYTVNEPERNGYIYQAFFGKADRRYPGLSLFMERETAKYFYSHHGSKLMNLQPDSGVEGLRYYKNSLGPLRQLKKYTVTIDTAKALAS